MGNGIAQPGVDHVLYQAQQALALQLRQHSPNMTGSANADLLRARSTTEGAKTRA